MESQRAFISLSHKVESRNQNIKISATDPSIKDFIEKIIVEEIELNNYIVTDVKPVIVSPIGSVPKSDGVTDSFMIVVCLQEAP